MVARGRAKSNGNERGACTREYLHAFRTPPPMEFFEHERHERWRGTKHLIFQFLRVRIDFKIAFFRSLCSLSWKGYRHVTVNAVLSNITNVLSSNGEKWKHVVKKANTFEIF